MEEVKVLDGGFAVGYVRVSGHCPDGPLDPAVQEHGIAPQKQMILEYAEVRGMRVVDWYVDVGQGRDLPGLERLLAAAESSEREFGTVLVESHSRVSRVRLNAIRARCRLRDAGVRLVSVTETVWDDSSAARLVEEVIQALDEMWRENHREATRQGIRAARERRRIDGPAQHPGS